MDEIKLDQFKEDFSLLIEAGFVAVKQLDEISASRLFQAAQVISPESTAPQLGLGYVALNKLEIKEATKIFEEVLKKEPEKLSGADFSWHLFSSDKAKAKKGETLIQESMQKATDPTVKSLCKISLEWAEKDLKKEKAPFFVTQQEAEPE